MPVVLGGSQGVGRFLMGEVPPQAMELTPELPGTKINYIDLGAGRVNSQPSILNSSPSTLHTLSTLNPQSYTTLNPAPTLNPQHSTLNSTHLNTTP